MQFKIKIPKDILTISEIFKTNGYELYLVGGCVRDALLEIRPKDYDLATNALPDTVIELLSKEKIITNILETGKNFGVINAIIARNEYEIATFRKDGNYTDGRRPDEIKFATINEDVLRRDLTINALYYDIDKGEVIDLVDGIEDLYKKTIRTVGSAKDRFTEDRLRVLRAVRFAHRFQSEMDFEIKRELLVNNDISKVSPERIRDEFIKIIKSSYSTKEALQELNEYGLLEQIIPSLFLNLDIDFQNSKNHLVVLILLLGGNRLNMIKSVLNELKYTKNEIHNILLSIKIMNIVRLGINSVGEDEIFRFVKEFKNGNPNIGMMKNLFKSFPEANEFLNNLIKFKFTITGEFVTENFNLVPGPEFGLKIRELEINNIKKEILNA